MIAGGKKVGVGGGAQGGTEEERDFASGDGLTVWGVQVLFD